ncbi:MAG: hypothetical protein K9N35_05865 [Candidatus Marinimicrobia bacterium]|nr:hypothetical protein [Candidatus Neomarinimicrobiota bacterium]
MTKYFGSLAIKHPDDLIFGYAPKPVSCGQGLTIGVGQVFPEINFTLPPMLINESNWNEVLSHYHNICENVLARAEKLRVPGIVMEFEHLPPMSMKPELGAEITSLIKNYLLEFYRRTGIPNALRVTVVDLRDADHPPLLRSGQRWEQTREAFILSAVAGADILSIESVGGKEVHDQALMYSDLSGIVASLGILACRDMGWLWDEIVDICKEYDVVPGGDTACGFSNTAMQMAGQGLLPATLSALVRAASAPRSLVAYEHGAIGPSKDCAYEGPIIKAITGVPISMEGKSSCCAHFSPLGNIAGAMADLWSNESVQNIKLLSGTAPEAFLELLAYDCRLFNIAENKNESRMYRDLLVRSDLEQSPEALMLEPQTVLRIARSIAQCPNPYTQTRNAIFTAFKSLQDAVDSNQLKLPSREQTWWSKIPGLLAQIPENENEAIEYLITTYHGVFNPQAYGL